MTIDFTLTSQRPDLDFIIGRTISVLDGRNYVRGRITGVGPCASGNPSAVVVALDLESE